MSTVTDILSSGACQAACITASTTNTRCRCQCAGELHGLISRAVVDSLVAGRSAGLHQLTDLQVMGGGIR